MKINKKQLFFMPILVLGLLAATYNQLIVNAADNDITDGNGITVDSRLDTEDAIIGNGICDDGSGNCTLRAAIQEANSNPDTSTINFAITGLADFTNGGEDGYTIAPSSDLPTITETVIIDGYSQLGASENTTQAPNPFDAVLLIELSGENNETIGYQETGLFFDEGSDNSIVKGLAINDFNTGKAINFYKSAGHKVQGNYIGTEPNGLSAAPNEIGVTNSTMVEEEKGINVQVGGLLPAERNILSGNSGGDIPTAGYPASGWVYQGNYVGLAADGVTAIPNSEPGGSGGISIDEATDVVVGGPEPTAINIFSGNNNQGMAPLGTENLTIQGNYIGTDYTGTVAIPNGTIGINLNESSNVLIKDNVISGNENNSGIYFDNNDSVVIQGNYIGTDQSGTIELPNTNGISSGPNNTNIHIGGTTSEEANTIAYNTSYGVGVQADTTLKNSIICNSIYENGSLGIDLGTNGVTANDEGDVDTGPNDYLNTPIIESVSESAGNTTVDYSLDVPAGNYRIELFSDSGKTFLKSQNVASAGSGEQNFTVTTSGTAYGDLVMTTTERDGSSDGFGSTSEFGATRPPVSDLSFTMQVIDNNEPNNSGSIRYRVTLTNNGPDSVDLANYNGAGGNPVVTNMFSALLAPEVSFTSDDSADVTCSFFAPASAFGPALGNHSSHNIISCAWSGSAYELQSGENYSIVITADVENPTPSNFTSYAFNVISEQYDPDTAAISVILNSGTDIVDGLIAQSINNIADVSWPLTGDEDSDNDGVLDSVEDAAPNNGDGNGDGSLDSTQASVASILDASGENYITLSLEKGGACTQISSFSATTEADQGSADADYDYPLGLNRFTIPCEGTVQGSIFYHALSELDGYTYRKFGPTTPGNNSTSAWYDGNFNYTNSSVGSATVAKANFSLTDGMLGDDTGDDGVIVDDNGPGVSIASPDNTDLVNTGTKLVIIISIGGSIIIASSYFMWKKTSSAVGSDT